MPAPMPSDSPKPHVMRGVIGVMRRDDRYLVIQRSAFVRVPLAWCFPGGEIESGESIEAALARELREELNVSVLPGRPIGVHEKHQGRLILHSMWAHLNGHDPTPNPAEVARCEWLRRDEIAALPGLLPGTLEIIDAAQSAD